MDPIANMLSQIRNAQNAHHEVLEIPYSKIKMAILAILKEHHQIADFHLIEKKIPGKKREMAKFSKIEINLLKENTIEIKRISKPGRRVYTRATNIPRPKRAKNMVIISTSRGILEGETARKKGLGGELICEVK